MKNIILIVLLFLVSLQAKDLEKVSLQLKWKYQFQFAGFIAAKEKGFYKEAGVNVNLKEFHNGINIIKDVEDGKVDFGISDSAVIYEALKNKLLVAMMGVFQESPFILIGLKSSNIKSINDLNGKKIALYGGVEGIEIRSMLQSYDIKYRAKPPAFTLDKLISKDIDLMIAYISNEPFIAKRQGIELTTILPKDYGFSRYGDILFTSQQFLKSHPKTVAKFYEASYRGWEYAYTHIDEVVDIIYRKYNTLHKTKEALKYEALTLKRLSHYGRDDFLKLNPKKIKDIIGEFNLVRHENNHLKNINSFIYKEAQNSTSLYTKKELEYIKSKKDIKVCWNKNQYPFIIFNDKSISGISMDYLKLIGKKSHLNFKFIESGNLQEEFKMVKDDVCDVAPLIITKPNHHKFLTPTNPIGVNSLLLVTKIAEPYISDLNHLEHKKIAVLKGGKNLIHYLKSKYPKIDFIIVDKLDLTRVDNGDFYGAISLSSKMLYKVANNFPNRLKIMTQIGDKKLHLSFGITNREPLLLSIFNKSIDGIPQFTKQKIIDSYLHFNVEKEFNYNLFIKLIFIPFFVIGILVFLYIKQRKLHKTIEMLNNSLEDRVKVATNELEEKNRLTNTLLNTTMEAVVIYDEEYKLVQINQAALEMLRFSPQDDPTSCYMFDFVTPQESQKAQKALKKQKTSCYEINLYRKDKTIFPALVQEKDIIINNKKHRVVTTMDLTEIKQKEQQLIQQSRLAQMGEMISMIAHQWRQPLAAISATSSAINLKAKLNKLDNDTAVKLSSKIDNYSQHLSKTIDDFRDFFKANKEKSKSSYDEVIESVLNIVETSIVNKNIKLIKNLNSQTIFNTYPNELKQVVLNLIKNAEDILLDNKIENPTITIETKDNVLTISDNAGGVPENIIDKIFDPYFSTKTKKDGTGLGLYMSKTIIEEHCGGKLSVSNSEEGAVFKIELQPI